MGFSGQQDGHPLGSPADIKERQGQEFALLSGLAPWQWGEWKQTLLHRTIPAYNAEHATFGNPATTQQGSPALPAVLNPSGICSDERSNHTGFITHPLPSPARTRLWALKQVCVPPRACLLSTQPSSWHHASKHHGRFPAPLHRPPNPH